jgi:oxalate---CoA ligase
VRAGAEALLDLIAAPDGSQALVEPASGERTTYGELRETADRLGRSLTAAGAGSGDAIAMSLPNGPEIVAAFLGVVAAGAAAAPLNQAYTADEFMVYLEDLQPRAMLFLRGEESPARAACEALGVRQLELTGERTSELALGPDAAAATAPRDPDAVALLLHTSGTTSKPKGVPIRQRNLAASARAVASTYRLSGSDGSHCAMPLFHVHGLVASTLATLGSGGCVIAPRRFSASAFWAECSAHGATWYSAVPTIHRILLSRAEEGAGDDAGHRLRFARSCSSALPGPLMDAFERRFGLPLVEAYGMTEAAHQMASNPLPPGERRAGSGGGGGGKGRGGVERGG